MQDRRAAPRIATALRGLAELEQVEAAVVCRGGGSLADLWAFCDENLCRTVALLRLPVVSAVGHEVDRTLIDDVSAVCCSTPTHAAEELVRVDVRAARDGAPGRRRACGARGSDRDPHARAAPRRAGRRAGAKRARTSGSASTRSSARCAPRRCAACVRATTWPSATRSSSRARARRAPSRPRRWPGSAPSSRRSAGTIRSGCSSAATRGSSRSTATPSPRRAPRARRSDVRVRFADDAVRARIEEDVER